MTYLDIDAIQAFLCMYKNKSHKHNTMCTQLKRLPSKHLENPYHIAFFHSHSIYFKIIMTLFISSASDTIPFQYKNWQQVHLHKLPLGASVYALKFGAYYYNNDCWCTSCNYNITVFRLQSDTVVSIQN